MKRRFVILILTVFYASSFFAVYNSETNAVNSEFKRYFEGVYEKAKINVVYHSQDNFDYLNKHFDIPEEYDFESAMCSLAYNGDYDTFYVASALEAVYDYDGNIVAKGGKFYSEPVKHSETVEETDDKLLEKMERALAEACDIAPEYGDGPAIWETESGCRYCRVVFKHDGKEFFYFAARAIDVTSETVKRESFLISTACITACYVALIGVSLVCMKKKKEQAQAIAE